MVSYATFVVIGAVPASAVREVAVATVADDLSSKQSLRHA